VGETDAALRTAAKLKRARRADASGYGPLAAGAAGALLDFVIWHQPTELPSLHLR
jgi:hypothetical protein